MPISNVSGSTAVTTEAVFPASRALVTPSPEPQEVSESSVRPSTIVTLSTTQNPSPRQQGASPALSDAFLKAPSEGAAKTSAVDEQKFPGLAAYARGEKGITLTLEEGVEALRLGIIPEGHIKSEMPLSEAWASQLFVRAGGAAGKLDVDQFSKQLAIVGIDSSRAKSMFKNFDNSGDGSLSVDEYYAGIKAGGEKVTALFQSLIDAYTRNADGSANEQATHQFLAEGSAMATTFWSRHS